MYTDIHKQDLRKILSRLKQSAKKRGILFNLTLSDIEEIGIPITCPVLGVQLYFNRGEQQDNSISFDRIDSNKGYTKDNIVIVSNRANRLKSDATLEEMSKITNYYANLSKLN